MKKIFKFICCGNVDDGKSTLIGRILLDTGNVKKDQLEDAKKASLKNGSEEIELAMLLDGLLSEREQQITIDIAHRYFDYKNIRFHILDCPGHEQYTKNMAIAAAETDSAIVVVDVTKGIKEQTKKHIQICSLFNVKNICICLTKCDLIFNNKKEPSQKRIKELTRQIETLMSSYSFNYTIIPVSAVTGYNVDKVLEQICSYAKNTSKKNNKSIIHILISKLFKGKRYYYGKEINDIEPVVGEKYNLLPSDIPVTIASNPVHGCFQIKENVDISSGDCIANCPVILSNFIKHKTIWFDKPTKNMLLKHGSRIAKVVKYTDETVELDNKIIFNNIEDIKQNGFGIFIDDVTKKTIGCGIFSGNNSTSKQEKIEGEIYFVPAKNHQDSVEKTAKFIKQKNIQPIVLNLWELKEKGIANSNQDEEAVYSMAKLLSQQKFDVIVTGKSQDIKKGRKNV